MVQAGRAHRADLRGMTVVVDGGITGMGCAEQVGLIYDVRFAQVPQAARAVGIGKLHQHGAILALKRKTRQRRIAFDDFIGSERAGA